MQTDVHVSQVFFRHIGSCIFFFLGMKMQKKKESCKVFVAYIDVSDEKIPGSCIFFCWYRIVPDII